MLTNYSRTSLIRHPLDWGYGRKAKKVVLSEYTEYFFIYILHTYKIISEIYYILHYLEKKSVIDFCLANDILDLDEIFLHFLIHKMSIGV